MISEIIRRAYKQLTAASPSSMQDPLGQSSVIYDDAGFRLVLTRVDELIHLDVEVSGPELEITDNSDVKLITMQSLRAAIRTIKLLELLVELVDHGFSLSLVESEFLWIADTILTNPPSESMLELLQSPIEE